MEETFGSLRPVAAVSPGVLGDTGMESAELIMGLCEKIKPACVIAVDALAARSIERLCRTVQIADTGIAPGSGVGNHRFALNRDSLGVPVIALGVPTVVDGATLAADLLGREEPEEGRELVVTPKDIDSQIADLSKILGYGISLALQPELTVADLAARENYSVSYFTHLFTRRMGVSPYRFILNQRLQSAAAMLQFTDRRVEEIAAVYRFSDAGRFILHFHRRFGLTPLQYRKAYQRGALSQE